ncbi:MAG: hypothetical protein KJO12_05875 [Ignavibacteria bacterium]|nr:hypothetical protein [Ignavibacteria bacterium]
MKKLLIFSLFSVLFFFGCNQESEITSPVDNSSNQQLKLISLPTPSGGLNIETDYTAYKSINGSVGGSFWASYSYNGGPNGMVYMTSGLNFPANSFTGTKNISQTFSSTGAAMVFGPPMQFYTEVYYSLKIGGLDLSGVNPATLDFVYIDANGNMYPCEYAHIAIDIASGVLAVYNVKLSHFSRYGFVN